MCVGIIWLNRACVMDRFIVRKPIVDANPSADSALAAGCKKDSVTNITSNTSNDKTSKKIAIFPKTKKQKLGDNNPPNTESLDDIVNNNNVESQAKPLPPAFSNWQKTFPWLASNSNNKAICSICTSATEKKLLLASGLSRSCHISRQAFVDTGVNCWKNANAIFRSHEASELHLNSMAAINDIKKQSVLQQMSSLKQKEMMDSRTALKKIFSTISVLTRQGMALRGNNNDEQSNFLQILRMRAEDVPELKTWLGRSGQTWLHHDVVNEILEIMAIEVLRQNLEFIRAAKYYALILDETSDISRIEQISICLRVVQDDLSVDEIFMGFHSTENTKSETLFKVVEDALLRFNLDIKNLRGQCYDGASNVSGRVNGLQARIQAVEPRALYVHCTAHTLNLVVQDAIEQVPCARNFIGIVKELINFLRDSPKRLAMFKQLQSANSPNLTAFCPTRWCVRVKSLKTINANYIAAMEFFDECKVDRDVDGSVSAKAAGFLKHMESFDFFFLLSLSIEIFERIEILNSELQKKDLCVSESCEKVKIMKEIFAATRDQKFQSVWEKAILDMSAFGVEEPKLPRVRKVSKRLESVANSSDAHAFSTPEDYYRKMYFEIYDRVLTSLDTRFQSNTMDFLQKCESFVLGNETVDIEEITRVYNNSGENGTNCKDFDESSLVRHRDMFIDVVSRQNVTLRSLKDVITFLKDNPSVGDLLPEFKKFIKILLTIPGSSCTSERSFSALRRLKSYLRSTMLQKRLNHIAIMHIHNDLAEQLDLDRLMDEFINRNKKRKGMFAICTAK